MSSLNIIATGMVVAVAATGGAFVGTFGNQIFASESGSSVPVSPLSSNVELLPVSVPVYADGKRLGYCVVNSSQRMSNNYSDEDYQVATTMAADHLINMLSTIPAEQDPQATCLSVNELEIGEATVDGVEFLPVGTGRPAAGG